MNVRPERSPTQGTLNSLSSETGRGERLADFVATAGERNYPPEIVEAAKTSLVDFVGVAVGAVGQPAAQAVRNVARTWNMPGNARIFCAGTTGAAMAALVNGTMAHCLDYDDTHLWGGGHVGVPCWSAALAIASDRALGETAALSAFITGYEVMARLGGGGIRGIGRNMQKRGFHPTGVNGAIGAAAVASAMAGLNRAATLSALSTAATSAGGLVASFGSDSKPFHGGKAAMNGILAADLAISGFKAAPRIFERRGGMLDAFIQDGAAEVPDIDFDDGWEILNNGYKPFACCRATHASIQAAHKLAAEIAGIQITRVVARVHAGALISAGKRDPQTPLEGKFSVPFCIALALRGYQATETDFSTERLHDPAIREIVPLVEMQPQSDQPQYEAYLDVELADGRTLSSETHLFLGHPDNPMTTEQHRTKFLSLTVPVLGNRKAEDLLSVLLSFEKKGALKAAMNLLDGEGLDVAARI